MASQREWTIGAQQVRFEPPDILWVRFQGGLPLEEAIALVDLYRELGTSSPFFLVADLRDTPVLGAESQRYLSDHVDHSWVKGNLFIGARLAHKAVVKGIYLAASLSGRMDMTAMAKNHFVSTPAEASELVARLRA
jgi:hypothetical protein